MEGPHALLLLAATATVVVVVGAASTSTTLVSANRNAKFLFASDPILCEGDNGHQGACLPYFNCGLFQGEEEGTCQVVGRCCVVSRSCGETSTARITYFNNDLLPIEDGETCSVTITTSSSVSSAAICQLHVSLDETDLTEPNAEGVCDLQYLEVKGGKGNSMKICGINKNQTVVVDVAGLDGPFKVSVETKDGAKEDSSWEVKVVQVPCNSEDDLAPSGCDQYLTGLEGEVKSYNYATEESSNPHETGAKGNRQLQESYRICVRQEEGYCSLKWTAGSDNDYAFTVSGDLEAVPPDGALTVDKQCEFTDYIVIAEATIEGEEEFSTNFCGSSFPEAVHTTSFQMNVVTNTEELLDSDTDNRGFHLKYEQIECNE